MKHRNMIFDFTQCYPKREGDDLLWNDCSAIPSSRLYCSDEAAEQLRGMIRPYGVSGIHFIDSGDYHYITKLMTDFIEKPFSLILIDHHTDMQKAAIGDMLSCGNWARRVVEENKFLEKLVLIGQEQKMLDALSVIHKDKVLGISYEELNTECGRKKLDMLDTAIPVYISIDKDVLNKKYAVTNWDQGKMSLSMLEHILKRLITEYKVIGVDICGEYPEENSLPEFLHAEYINGKSDEELYRFLIRNLSV